MLIFIEQFIHVNNLHENNVQFLIYWISGVMWTQTTICSTADHLCSVFTAKEKQTAKWLHRLCQNSVDNVHLAVVSKTGICIMIKKNLWTFEINLLTVLSVYSASMSYKPQNTECFLILNVVTHFQIIILQFIKFKQT